MEAVSDQLAAFRDFAPTPIDALVCSVPGTPPDWWTVQASIDLTLKGAIAVGFVCWLLHTFGARAGRIFGDVLDALATTFNEWRRGT